MGVFTLGCTLPNTPTSHSFGNQIVLITEASCLELLALLFSRANPVMRRIKRDIQNEFKSVINEPTLLADLALLECFWRLASFASLIKARPAAKRMQYVMRM